MKRYRCQFLDMNEEQIALSACGTKAAAKEYVKQVYAKLGLDLVADDEWAEHVMVQRPGHGMSVVRVGPKRSEILIENQKWPKNIEEIEARAYGIPLG